MKLEHLLAIPAGFILAPVFAVVGAILVYCVVMQSAWEYMLKGFAK